MAITLVTGTLGIGKTAFAVCRAIEANTAGGWVAANFHIDLPHPERFINLGTDPTEWWDKIYVGFNRSTEHPPFVVVLDEVSEICNQYARPSRDLETYLRHSDKIGHTIYMITQRAGHMFKTGRDLAAKKIFLFRFCGIRWYIRISEDGKMMCHIPRPVSILPAFGHYDTSAIVSPHRLHSYHTLPRREWILRRKNTGARRIALLLAALQIATLLVVAL